MIQNYLIFRELKAFKARNYPFFVLFTNVQCTGGHIQLDVIMQHGEFALFTVLGPNLSKSETKNAVPTHGVMD